MGTACAASRKAKQGERLYFEHNYVLLGHHAKRGETERKISRKSKSFISFNPHKDLKSFLPALWPIIPILQLRKQKLEVVKQTAPKVIQLKPGKPRPESREDESVPRLRSSAGFCLPFPTPSPAESLKMFVGGSL